MKRSMTTLRMTCMRGSSRDGIYCTFDNLRYFLYILGEGSPPHHPCARRTMVREIAAFTPSLNLALHRSLSFLLRFRAGRSWNL